MRHVSWHCVVSEVWSESQLSYLTPQLHLSGEGLVKPLLECTEGFDLCLFGSSLKSNAFQGIWGSHAVRTCSAPALPAGRITALQAVDLWKRHFEERGVTEPDHSSHYILAHLLGAKTVSWNVLRPFYAALCFVWKPARQHLLLFFLTRYFLYPDRKCWAGEVNGAPQPRNNRADVGALHKTPLQVWSF